MLYFLYIAVLLINLLLFVKRKRSKAIAVLSVIFIILVMGGNTYNDDYIGYYDQYVSNNFTATIEILFLSFEKLLRGAGASYNGFLIALFTVCALCYIHCAKEYTNEYHLLVFLYMLYMIFWDVVQIRFTAAEFVFLLGVIFLAKKKKIAYVITIIIAGLFHRSVLLLILLVYISPNKSYSKRMAKLFALAIVVLCVATAINGNRIPYVFEVAEFFMHEGLRSKLVYFNTRTRFGYLYSWLVYFLNVYVVFVSRNFIRRYAQDDELALRDYADVLYIVCISMAFLMPLTMMNSNFTRYIRILNLPIYILFAACFTLYHRVVRRENGAALFRLAGKYYGKINVYLLVFTINMICWTTMKLSGFLITDLLDNNMFFS